MTITPGKISGMKAVSTDKGVIGAAAMDQRGSLQKALAKEIMLASEANPDSYAIGKKEEVERQAEAAHN